MLLGRALTEPRAQAAATEAALEVLWQSGVELCFIAVLMNLAKKVQTVTARMAELERTQEALDAQVDKTLRKFTALELEVDALRRKAEANDERIEAAEVRATVYMALTEQLFETRVRLLLAESAMLRALLDAKEDR